MKDINIDEMIADAQAEEIVRREQEKARSKKVVTDTFKEELKGALRNMLADITPTDEQTIRITLSEYISLVYMVRDLELLKDTLIDNMNLGYNKEYVVLNNDEKIINVLKLLFPADYNEAYRKLYNSDTNEA